MRRFKADAGAEARARLIPHQGAEAPTPHIRLDAVDSTMAEALRRAKALEHDALWIIALRQTAGRGRRGRMWVSEPGNLYATLLLRDPGPAARFGELCFVAGVALHEAVAESVAGERLRLKWPNDLLCDGAKLAGILIEAETAGRSHVAIGFGVNCAHHPGALGRPATDLAAAGSPVTPDVLFGRLDPAMRRWIRAWRRGAGFETVRRAWLERARGLGQPILVRLPGRTLEGVFDSLDAHGRLMLRLPSGAVEPIAAGEIFFDGSG